MPSKYFHAMWLFLCIAILCAGFAAANGTGTSSENPYQGLLAVSIYAFVGIIILSVLAAVFQKNIGENGKKAAFFILAAVIVLTTIYLGGSIVLTNVTSVTGGPVHWHADYEIWACGEKIETKTSEGFSNRVGTPLFHNHNDDRIHVEGVVMDWKEIHLGVYFKAIGGDFTQEALTLILKDGTTKTWRNGDRCPNGHAGTLKLYVNGVQNDKMDEYIISPYSNIPPGDFLKIVFD